MLLRRVVEGVFYQLPNPSITVHDVNLRFDINGSRVIEPEYGLAGYRDEYN